jgi:hypothetical protein
MAKIELTFERVEHDVTEYGSDELTVGARVFFSTKRDGILEGSFHADLTYPADADPQTAEIHVEKPPRYVRSLPQEAFAEEASAYLRGLVASGNLAGQQRQPRSFLRRHAIELRSSD